jgi:hypothetical protein
MALPWEVQKELYRRDAHAFIFSALKTKDEHLCFDEYGGILDSVKPFPDEPYLRATLDDYLVGAKLLKPSEAKHSLAAGTPIAHLERLFKTGIYFTEKSRHVMATWLTCAYLLWRARALPHQLIMVQSKREEDVAPLVYDKEPSTARISFMEDSLPDELRMTQFPRDGKWCHIYFSNGSHIWGIPQGSGIIRSHNPSVLFSDEAAFQPEFGDAFTAALPACTHGGQLIVVSSAEVSEFMTLVEAA